MRRFSGAIGVEQGDDEVFSDFMNGGDMWTGEGARERRHKIKFSEAFRGTPMVHVSLSLWDMDMNANVRADVTSDNVTSKGFELVFRTWAETRVARVRMSWMAIGEVTSDDDWSL